jgi:hypothetical protein
LLTDIKFDDDRFIKKLKCCADTNSEFTLSAIEEVWIEVTKHDSERQARKMALLVKTTIKSSGLKYFTIKNARRNTIHILADDVSVARLIAYRANRITKPSHGDIRMFDTVSIEKLAYGKAIEEARVSGWPGEVEIIGDKVVHCDRREIFG